MTVNTLTYLELMHDIYNVYLCEHCVKSKTSPEPSKRLDQKYVDVFQGQCDCCAAKYQDVQAFVVVPITTPVCSCETFYCQHKWELNDKSFG